MLGPDHRQQEDMAAQMGASLEQIERETSAFMKRLALRWAIRWALVFAVIFVLTRLVDWLDWLWWFAVPMAVLSLAVPLLFRRVLMKRLAKMRGQFGGFGAGMGGGETIDGAWRDAGPSAQDDPPADPSGIIIDQRPVDRDED